MYGTSRNQMIDIVQQYYRQQLSNKLFQLHISLISIRSVEVTQRRILLLHGVCTLVSSEPQSQILFIVSLYEITLLYDVFLCSSLPPFATALIAFGTIFIFIGEFLFLQVHTGSGIMQSGIASLSPTIPQLKMRVHLDVVFMSLYC